MEITFVFFLSRTYINKQSKSPLLKSDNRPPSSAACSGARPATTAAARLLPSLRNPHTSAAAVGRPEGKQQGQGRCTPP